MQVKHGRPMKTLRIPRRGWPLRLLLGLGLAAVTTLVCEAQWPTVDDFNPGASGPVYSFGVQADGKILVGGSFTTLGGQPRNRIGRLNADGTVDEGFNPGANSTVSSLAVQADGEIHGGNNASGYGG